MPALALAAVLLAALTHATWNLAAKRAAGSRHFVWMYSAVKMLLISPFIVDYAGNLMRVVFLAPRALRDRKGLRDEVRRYARPVAIVSVLGPLGYILVLYAMQLAPVSHVAPARELSTLIGTWFGARLLREKAAPARPAGSACIVAGVISLALAGG